MFKTNTIITDNITLNEFYNKCLKEKVLAVDTEFIRDNTYYPSLCLIQIAGENFAAAIDPLSGLEMQPIWDLLANEKILKVFHAARQDIEIFFNIYKKIPRPIIDTQIYLIALGYNHSISYANACKDLLNIQLDKNNQFIDWRKRPLNKNKISYAINDVRYLIPLFKKIQKGADSQSLRKIKNYHKKITDIKIYSERSKRAWEKLRFKPCNDLELKSLKKYCALREKLAMNKNIPVKRVVSDKEIKLISRLNINKKVQEKIFKKLNIFK